MADCLIGLAPAQMHRCVVQIIRCIATLVHRLHISICQPRPALQTITIFLKRTAACPVSPSLPHAHSAAGSSARTKTRNAPPWLRRPQAPIGSRDLYLQRRASGSPRPRPRTRPNRSRCYRFRANCRGMCFSRSNSGSTQHGAGLAASVQTLSP
jgi:hypothetical protein